MPKAEATPAGLPSVEARQENLALWAAVQKTDPRFTKAVDDGRHKFTAIDAYYQIKRATEFWGPYGSTWGLFDIEYGYELLQHGLVVLHAVFKYPDGSFPITNSAKAVNSKGVPNDDFTKKIETDTITKCLSRLGFNADVFLGFFDDHRYVDSLNRELADQAKQRKGQAAQAVQAPAKASTQAADSLDAAREKFLHDIEQLADAVSKYAGKRVEGAVLIERKLAQVPGWPPGMPGDWNTVEMYRAACGIIADKLAETAKGAK